MQILKQLQNVNIVQDIASIFLTTNANGKVIPRPTQEYPTAVALLVEKHRLPSERPEPVFDFELSAKTLKQVENHCITNGLRLADFTQTIGIKVFYDRTGGEDPERLNDEFMEVSHPEAADPVNEVSVLHFINGDKTLPDWSASLANLKELGKDRVYSIPFT
jgi:hypothetical protein